MNSLSSYCMELIMMIKGFIVEAHGMGFLPSQLSKESSNQYLKSEIVMFNKRNINV